MNPDILFPGESNPEDTRRQLECVHVTRKNKSNRGLTQRTQTTRFWHRAWHARLLARRLKSDSFWPGGSFVLSRAWIARQRMRDCVMLLHSIAITRRTGYYVFLFLVNTSSFDDLHVWSCEYLSKNRFVTLECKLFLITFRYTSAFKKVYQKWPQTNFKSKSSCSSFFSIVQFLFFPATGQFFF